MRRPTFGQVVRATSPVFPVDTTRTRAAGGLQIMNVQATFDLRGLKIHKDRLERALSLPPDKSKLDCMLKLPTPVRFLAPERL